MKFISNSPGDRELHKRYLIIAAVALLGLVFAISVSHLLVRRGHEDLALAVVIVFGLAVFLVVVWLFKDFFEPTMPTDADTEITESDFTDALTNIAEKKADDTDD